MDDVVLKLTPRGPIDRLQAKIGLVHPDGKRLLVRALLAGLVAWVPLLLLTLFLPHAESSTVSFFRDIAAHVRFLIVIPVLIMAEASIGTRTQMVVENLATSGVIPAESMPSFRSAVDRANRRADSFWIEALILVGTFAAVWVTSRGLIADKAVFWYEQSTAHGMRLTEAGFWYIFVSSPIVVFLFVRWLWRYIVWSLLLRRVSRLDLRLSRSHPDNSGGLAFITVGHTSFAMVSFAASCVLAAASANRILYEGVSLKDYQSAIIGFLVLSVAFGLIPLVTFTSALVKAKRRGIVEYGRFGTRYVQAFEGKWLSKDSKNEADMLGSADIQSLADLGGSYERLDQMRAVPFDRRTIMSFTFAAATPMLPLLLTVMNLREMISLIVKAMI